MIPKERQHWHTLSQHTKDGCLDSSRELQRMGPSPPYKGRRGTGAYLFRLTPSRAKRHAKALNGQHRFDISHVPDPLRTDALLNTRFRTGQNFDVADGLGDWRKC